MRYGPTSGWPRSKGQHEGMVFQSLFVIPKKSKTEKKETEKIGFIVLDIWSHFRLAR